MLFKCGGKERDHAEIDVTDWLARLRAPILKQEQRTGDLGKGHQDCGLPADMLSGLAYRRGRLSRRYLCLHRGGGGHPRTFARQRSGTDSDCI